MAIVILIQAQGGLIMGRSDEETNRREEKKQSGSGTGSGVNGLG